MANKERIRLLAEIGQLQDANCKNCSLKKNDERYCLTKCEIGQELQKLGDELIGTSQKRRELKAMGVKGEMEATKDNYLQLKSKKKKDKEIMKIFGVGHTKLHKLKEEWGLVGKTGRIRKDVPKAAPSIKPPEQSDEVKKLLEEKKDLEVMLETSQVRILELEHKTDSLTRGLNEMKEINLEKERNYIDGLTETIRDLQLDQDDLKNGLSLLEKTLGWYLSRRSK